MKYYKQVLTVTMWEYRRFYKLKNELLGIVIMLIVFSLSYFVSKYALSGSKEKSEIAMLKGSDSLLISVLSTKFEVKILTTPEYQPYIDNIKKSKKGIYLAQDGQDFVLQSWKKPGEMKLIKATLDEYRRMVNLNKVGLTKETLNSILETSEIKESFFIDPKTHDRKTLSYFFAGLMIMAVFLSFTYQFTAITGEKQLKITEQIISAIKPQVWMDGKILGIALTGLSSMLTYSVIGALGGTLFFQFSGTSLSSILPYLHVPSILLYFAFTLIGILIWNAFMASVASVITDPNNSGKSSLMLLPLLFVLAAFLVIKDPDNGFSLFLSWFPLTSATAMPIRWAITEVSAWEVSGSFLVLIGTFYFFRKLAAKIFHVSVLISGKEPSWREIIQLSRDRI
jgi:ABC-2 type transport system permease protein